MEHKEHLKIELGSERNFGLVMSCAFLVVALIFFRQIAPLSFGFIFLGVCVFAVAVSRPKLLEKPNFLWHRFGLLLGAVIAPVVLMTIFLFVVTPTRFVMWLFQHDPMSLKIDREADTYWVERDLPMQSMEKQY